MVQGMLYFGAMCAVQRSYAPVMHKMLAISSVCSTRKANIAVTFTKQFHLLEVTHSVCEEADTTLAVKAVSIYLRRSCICCSQWLTT